MSPTGFRRLAAAANKVPLSSVQYGRIGAQKLFSFKNFFAVLRIVRALLALYPCTIYKTIHPWDDTYGRRRR